MAHGSPTTHIRTTPRESYTRLHLPSPVRSVHLSDRASARIASEHSTSIRAAAAHSLRHQRQFTSGRVQSNNTHTRSIHSRSVRIVFWWTRALTHSSPVRGVRNSRARNPELCSVRFTHYQPHHRSTSSTASRHAARTRNGNSCKMQGISHSAKRIPHRSMHAGACFPLVCVRLPRDANYKYCRICFGDIFRVCVFVCTCRMCGRGFFIE